MVLDLIQASFGANTVTELFSPEIALSRTTLPHTICPAATFMVIRLRR